MKLASVFANHAVLQRDSSVPIWGREACSGHLLCAEIAGRKSFARASCNGEFMFHLPALHAGGPYNIIVQDTENDEKCILTDIWIGEVWLCGGQSNMQYLLGSDWTDDAAVSAEKPDECRINLMQLREYVDTLKEDGMIRSLTVPMEVSGSRETDVRAEWRVLDRKNAAELSAVGAWFARTVQEKMKVAVGLLVCNWGGTRIEAWTSRAGLLANPMTAHLPEGCDETMQNKDAWSASGYITQERILEEKKKQETGIVSFSEMRRICWGPYNKNSPSLLFDGMIRPLLPYAIRGVLWYQGESNADSIAEALAYRDKLKTMIQDWRNHWEEGDFPFIQVQLAGYRQVTPYDAKSAWAVLREAQLQCCKELQNVYMVSAVDLGEAEDIHPQNKKDVGYRLAQCALHYVYGRGDMLPCGPMIKCMRSEGRKIRLFFNYATGLHFKGKPRGFHLWDIDGCMFPADICEIENDTLLLSAKASSAPVHVAYGWSDNPDGNLYNAADFPASPFRTDALPRWERMH